jgi:hypothetical protein
MLFEKSTAKPPCVQALAADQHQTARSLPISTPTLKRELPEAAVLASLGCGNPTALAELRQGDRALHYRGGDPEQGRPEQIPRLQRRQSTQGKS